MSVHFQSGVAVALASSLLMVACSSSLQVRSADTYRDDTRTLLGANSGEFQACYDRALETDPNAGGTIAVMFEVEEETGKVANAKVAEEETTASATLQQCVVETVAGLSLQPPDENRGEAKMLFAFEGP